MHGKYFIVQVHCQGRGCWSNKAIIYCSVEGYTRFTLEVTVIHFGTWTSVGLHQESAGFSQTLYLWSLFKLSPLRDPTPILDSSGIYPRCRRSPSWSAWSGTQVQTFLLKCVLLFPVIHDPWYILLHLFLLYAYNWSFILTFTLVEWWSYVAL